MYHRLASKTALIALCTAGASLAACGEDGPTKGSDTTTQPTTCRLTLDDPADAALVIGVGAHAAVGLMRDGATPSIVSAPAGWGAALDPDGMTLRLVAPYDAPNASAGNVVIANGCADSPGELTVAVGTRAATWSALGGWDEGTTGPRAREYFAFWQDDKDPDTAWLFGGFQYVPEQFTPSNDLWRLDLVTGTWTSVEHTNTAPLLAGGGMAQEPNTGALVYYGGLGRTGNSFALPFSLQSLEADTTATWMPIAPDGAPANGDYQPAFFWDADASHFLAVGGQGPHGPHMDLHAFHPASNTWHTLTPDTPDGAPAGRAGFFWVHDAETRRLIIFGGDRGGESATGCDCAPDTWALELGETPMRWVRLADGSDGPEGRRNGAYTLDHDNHRMIIWGGTADGATADPVVYAFDLRRGHEGWHTLPTTGATPPARASGGAIHDGARGRIIAGFGNSSEGIFVDLWALQF